MRGTPRGLEEATRWLPPQSGTIAAETKLGPWALACRSGRARRTLAGAIRAPPIQLRQRFRLGGVMNRRWARVPPSGNNATSSLQDMPASRDAAAWASALAARTRLREIMEGEGTARCSIANIGPRLVVLPDYTANSEAHAQARAGAMPGCLAGGSASRAAGRGLAAGQSWPLTFWGVCVILPVRERSRLLLPS